MESWTPRLELVCQSCFLSKASSKHACACSDFCFSMAQAGRMQSRQPGTQWDVTLHARLWNCNCSDEEVSQLTHPTVLPCTSLTNNPATITRPKRKRPTKRQTRQASAGSTSLPKAKLLDFKMAPSPTQPWTDVTLTFGFESKSPEPVFFRFKLERLGLTCDSRPVLVKINAREDSGLLSLMLWHFICKRGEPSVANVIQTTNDFFMAWKDKVVIRNKNEEDYLLGGVDFSRATIQLRNLIRAHQFIEKDKNLMKLWHERWVWACLSRARAELLLENEPEGTFLLRVGNLDKKPRLICISVREGDGTQHVEIESEKKKDTRTYSITIEKDDDTAVPSRHTYSTLYHLIMKSDSFNRTFRTGSARTAVEFETMCTEFQQYVLDEQRDKTNPQHKGYGNLRKARGKQQDQTSKQQTVEEQNQTPETSLEQPLPNPMLPLSSSFEGVSEPSSASNWFSSEGVGGGLSFLSGRTWQSEKMDVVQQKLDDGSGTSFSPNGWPWRLSADSETFSIQLQNVEVVENDLSIYLTDNPP